MITFSAQGHRKRNQNFSEPLLQVVVVVVVMVVVMVVMVVVVVVVVMVVMVVVVVVESPRVTGIFRAGLANPPPLRPV